MYPSTLRITKNVLTYLSSSFTQDCVTLKTIKCASDYLPERSPLKVYLEIVTIYKTMFITLSLAECVTYLVQRFETITITYIGPIPAAFLH